MCTISVHGDSVARPVRDIAWAHNDNHYIETCWIAMNNKKVVRSPPVLAQDRKIVL
jgi:hypothetical protein